MTSALSRRGFFETMMGASAAVLVTDAAAATSEQLYPVHGYFKWFSTKHGFGYFEHDYLDETTIGTMLRLKDGPARRASLRPFTPAGEKLRRLIVPGEPVTLFGPMPFGAEAAHIEWRVSAIECRAELVHILTWLEPYEDDALLRKRGKRA